MNKLPRRSGQNNNNESDPNPAVVQLYNMYIHPPPPDMHLLSLLRFSLSLSSTKPVINLGLIKDYLGVKGSAKITSLICAGWRSRGSVDIGLKIEGGVSVTQSPHISFETRDLVGDNKKIETYAATFPHDASDFNSGSIWVHNASLVHSDLREAYPNVNMDELKQYVSQGMDRAGNKVYLIDSGSILGEIMAVILDAQKVAKNNVTLKRDGNFFKLDEDDYQQWWKFMSDELGTAPNAVDLALVNFKSYPLGTDRDSKWSLWLDLRMVYSV